MTTPVIIAVSVFVGTGALALIFEGLRAADQPKQQRAPRGRHYYPEPVGPDYNPLAPADRQILAGTYWETRQLTAGPGERTGYIEVIRP